MNPQAQRQRGDAIRQMRADVDTVMERVCAELDVRLAQIRKDMGYDLREAERERRAADAVMLASAIDLAKAFSEPIRRSFFGRIKWLVTGW